MEWGDDMARLLIAIPTKGRHEMVCEVLKYEIPYYKKYNVDLCYYDSSEDDLTKLVICEAENKYGVRIQYKLMDASLCLDYKIVEIFKDFETLEYDYYWLVNDSISFSEAMLKYVLDIIEHQFDLLRLPLSGGGNIEDYITDNVNDWFHNCSQGMAHMASTIMNKSLLLAPHNWSEMSSKYIVNNNLDDKHGFFFGVGFYLEQIAKLNKFNGIFIGNKIKWRRDSHLKREQVYWKTFVFEAWAKSYCETIFAIPDLYTDKEYVIYNSDNLYCGRFSKEMLIHYRLNGMYGLEQYNKYHDYFKYITLESEETCFEIASTSIEVLKKNYPNLATVEAEWDLKLDRILKKYKEQKKYIYGAGLYAEKVLCKLCENNYANYIAGVFVTNKGNNVKSICGIEVCQIDEIKSFEDSIIIVCALPANASSMKKELINRKIENYIGLFDV